MSPKHLDASLCLSYHRDARIFPSLNAQTLPLSDALHVAVENHRPGEYPVIIGVKLQLIGIDAIKAAQNAIEKKIS